MSDSCSDRQDKILEDFLGEENLRQCKKLGLSEERLMSLYHKEFDRDQEEFRSAVEGMLEEEKVREFDRMVKDEIQNMMKSIEMLQGARIRLSEDWIREKGGQ